ncbi:MAG: HEAT repeat domain-containing protein [Candidatus Kariarchaeaceae archaeon]|jgi:deoxyhypusine monooxygenase
MDYSVFMGVKTQEERIQAVFQLLVENSPRSVTLLQEGLRIDTSPIVRHECAYSLGELSFEDGYEALTKAITQDENKFVVHEAALALSNLGVEVAYTVLEDLLNNSNQDIVLTAEISLERLRMKLSGDKIEGKEKAEAMLLDLTTHPEHRIQSAFWKKDRRSQFPFCSKVCSKRLIQSLSMR